MIWLSQWLCAARHCAIALAWDDATHTAAEMATQGEAVFGAGGFERQCGLCGGALHVEHAATLFATLAEAQPHLAAAEADQRATRAALAAGDLDPRLFVRTKADYDA